MAKFEIIVGTMLGASEYVADALLESLEKYQHSGNIHLEPNLTDLDQQATWIICTSTHGAGDLPDNIQPFCKQLAQAELTDTTFMIIGLGDSSYDTFCFAAKQIEKILTQCHAKLLRPALHIDVLHHPIPEEVATKWLEHGLDDQT